MSDKIMSLWPTDFGTIPEPTPISILRQQGVLLGEQTSNIVVGRVVTRGSGANFLQMFSLFCPPLGYSIDLLYVSHGVELYPATVNIVAGEGPTLSANNANELREHLKNLFALPKTRAIIASLIAQSQG
jgi:hypothetical protein